jgi:hypothetical protein
MSYGIEFKKIYNMEFLDFMEERHEFINNFIYKYSV